MCIFLLCMTVDRPRQELIYLEEVDLMELNLPLLICACCPRFQRTKVYPVGSGSICEMVQISGTV